MRRVARSLLAGSCAWLPGRAPLVPAEEALLTRRVEGLRSLLARGNGGSLLDFDQILVVIHQDVVRDLLRATTPFEKSIVERHKISVASAAAEFGSPSLARRLGERRHAVGVGVEVRANRMPGANTVSVASPPLRGRGGPFLQSRPADPSPNEP